MDLAVGSDHPRQVGVDAHCHGGVPNLQPAIRLYVILNGDVIHPLLALPAKAGALFTGLAVGLLGESAEHLVVQREVGRHLAQILLR